MARHRFWIDEVATLFPGSTRGSGMLDLLRHWGEYRGSPQVTPLYVMLVALWARLGPAASEMALRCVNLPFLAGTALVAWGLVRRLPFRSAAGRWAALAFVACSPLYIYYAFDLRPYASLIFYGGMIALGLVMTGAWEARGPWLIAAGFGLGFLTQPTTVLLAPPLGLLVLQQVRRDPARSLRLWRGAALLGLVLSAAAGSFYFSFRHGDGMGSFGGGPDWKNGLFVLFEFGGLSGLGPSRERLRALAPPAGAESALHTMAPAWSDWLPAALGALLWVAGTAYLLRHAWAARRSPAWPGGALGWNAALLVGGFLCFTIFFSLFRYRFLPRHVCILYLPFLFLLLAAAAATTLRAPGRGLAALAGLALLGFAASSAQLLFNPQHARDDYRGVLRTWRAEQTRDPAVRLWIFGSPPMLLYYSGEARVWYLEEQSVDLCERTGPASFERTVLAPERLAEAAAAPLVVMRNPTPEIWSALCAANRGQRVILAVNRGTEFDLRRWARQWVNDPAAHAVKLPWAPFVESFDLVVP